MNWKEKIKSLPMTYKIIAGVVLLALTFLLFTQVQNGWSGIRGWWFDRNIAQIEQKNAELQKEYDTLKAENAKLKLERVDLDAQVKVYEAEEKKIPEAVKKEQEKLEGTLAGLDKEMAEAEKPTDAFTRCTRYNASKPKYPLNCEEYR